MTQIPPRSGSQSMVRKRDTAHRLSDESILVETSQSKADSASIRQPDTAQSLKSEKMGLFRWRKVPLQTIVIVPFVLQIFAVVGLVGFLSYRNGQQTVNDLATQLRNEITARIEQRLDTFLETPHVINQINADAVARGQLKAQDANSERYLWNQLSLFESVSWIYFGAEKDGNFIGAARSGETNALRLVIADPSTENFTYYYSFDEQGNRTGVVERNRERKYDSRTRPWYTAAVAARKPIWSEIYPDFTSKKLAISPAVPAYSATGALIGVCAIDLFLEDISQYLKTLKIGQSGRTFIVERTGEIVASSADEVPFILEENGEDAKRLKASESSDPLIRATAEYLAEQSGGWSSFNTMTQLDFNAEGRNFVQVLPYADEYGLDWLIVTVVPESDFMGKINANTQATILLCLAALGVATVAGIYTSRWVTRPILQLQQASKAIADGNWDQTIEVEGADELEKLSHSFNQMTDQLYTTFKALEDSNQALEDSNRDLERRVEERTAELNQAKTAAEAAKTALQNRAIQLMQEVSPIQKGDLTVRPYVTSDEIGSIAESYTMTISSLRTIILQVQTAAERVVASSQTNQTSVYGLSEEAARQAQEINQALHQIEQLQQVVQQVAQEAQKAEVAVLQAEQVVDEGDTAMDRTVREIEAIRTVVSETVKKAQHLSESSEQISRVVELINQFASQTNMLSLNSSVEAARAGEYGKGFATIALEVRKLAGQSAQAAQEIRTLVTNIQLETKQVVTAMAAGNQRVETGTQLVNETRQSLNKITAVSRQINEVVASIVQSTVVQSQMSDTVIETMKDVAAIASDTSAEANQVLASFEELRRVAQTLQSEVSQFKV